MEPKPADALAPAAGLDEAGRGCLAGPVVAAAVILPRICHLPGLTDSKKLSPKKRFSLALSIKQQAAAWSLGVVWPRRIDKINILAASLEAMARAAGTLKISPRHLLIDGNQTIPDAVLNRFLVSGPMPRQSTIIKGDSLVKEISAASIIAKTFRDNLMIHLHKRWPGYNFAQHKGYGVKAHYEALARLGPCPMHRLSFRGVIAQPGLI